MKKTKSISRLAVVALAAGSFTLIGVARAQDGTGFSSTADNPHLRHTEPTAKAGAKLTDKDKKFILKAAAAGRMEIENGKMAERRAKNSATRNVAAQMVADHSKANKELVALAKEKGLGVTTDNVKAQDIGNANFDKQYLTDLQTYHKQDIASFENQARSGDDAELKAWAAKNLPTLKSHLAMAKDTLKKMK